MALTILAVLPQEPPLAMCFWEHLALDSYTAPLQALTPAVEGPPPPLWSGSA